MKVKVSARTGITCEIVLGKVRATRKLPWVGSRLGSFGTAATAGCVSLAVFLWLLPESHPLLLAW